MQQTEHQFATNHQSATHIFRGLNIGDIGLITSRQAQLYHNEYGWDINYEALVAEILSNSIAFGALKALL